MFAIGRTPVTPVVKGKPVALVSTRDDGVPKAGVTKVGLVAKTAAPVPVSSLNTPSNCDEVVAANWLRGLPVTPHVVQVNVLFADRSPPPPRGLVVEIDRVVATLALKAAQSAAVKKPFTPEAASWPFA
jgi:hypothetical protein